MIKHLKRKEIDIEKYDYCIENSVQSRIYAFSWYLDIVADNWCVLVLNDYEAVMPLPWKRKYGIKYVYPPFWVLELGVFSLEKQVAMQLFYTVLFKKFRFIETRLNTANKLYDSSSNFITKEMQVLPLEEEYATISNKYRKDRKKDLHKANKFCLVEKDTNKAEVLIDLFKNNVGKRTPKIVENDYSNLKKIIEVCLEKKVGELLSIYDNENNLVAAGFFLKHKKVVTILVSSTDFNNRNNGANTFLIDRAIYKYQNNFDVFNFGGSSIKSIANYFFSFGAQNRQYDYLKRILL